VVEGNVKAVRDPCPEPPISRERSPENGRQDQALFEPHEFESDPLSDAVCAERYRLAQARRLLASPTILHGGHLVRKVELEGGGYAHIQEDALHAEMRPSEVSTVNEQDPKTHATSTEAIQSCDESSGTGPRRARKPRSLPRRTAGGETPSPGEAVREDKPAEHQATSQSAASTETGAPLASEVDENPEAELESDDESTFEPGDEIHFQLSCLCMEMPLAVRRPERPMKRQLPLMGPAPDKAGKLKASRSRLVHRVADHLLETIASDDPRKWARLAGADNVLQGGRVGVTTWKDRKARKIIEHAIRAKRPRYQALYDALRGVDPEFGKVTLDDVRAACAPPRGPNAVLACLRLTIELGRRPTASESARRTHRYRQMK
jgi:hypothetical protein